MKTQTIRPTGHPQAFGVDETFFSTTDPKGVITAGNAIFSRISGFSVGDLLGQPHNIIRHPDMPRLVFRLLWEACRGGRLFMGYVKNQAKNGNHYWVFAVVVPIPTGFLSVRFKPTSPLQAVVEAIYAKLLAAEAAAIAAGRSEAQAAEAAAGVAVAEINRAGFESYDAFSHHALNTEIKSRDAEIQRQQRALFPEKIGRSEQKLPLVEFYEQARTIYRNIDSFFELLDSFILLCDGIRTRKEAVQKIAAEFRLNAFNANIAAHVLGDSGIALSKVAEHLSGHGEGLARNVATLAASIAPTIGSISDLASNLSAARLQVEMLLSFTAEISSGAKTPDEVARALGMIRDLRVAFSNTLQQAFGAIRRLTGQLPAVMVAKKNSRRDIVSLQVTQSTGLTEVARLPHAEALTATFTDLRTQIERGKRELDELDQIAQRLSLLTADSPVRIVRIQKALGLLHDLDAATPPADAPAA